MALFTHRTDVLLSDLAECLSCFETSRGLRVGHFFGRRTDAPCCPSCPWLNVAFDHVEQRHSRRHISLRLLWYLSRNLALSYQKYFMMQTWLRRSPATNYACLAQKHLIHVKLPTIEFGKILSTTQACFTWNHLIIAIDQLITFSIVSDKIHAYVPQILCRWIDIYCMLCWSLSPISFGVNSLAPGQSLNCNHAKIRQLVHQKCVIPATRLSLIFLNQCISLA